MHFMFPFLVLLVLPLAVTFYAEPLNVLWGRCEQADAGPMEGGEGVGI